MADVTATVEGYIDSWNETDPDRRRAIIARVWTEDASYVDPLAVGIDFGTVAADGRLRAVTGFLEPVA